MKLPDLITKNRSIAAIAGAMLILIVLGKWVYLPRIREIFARQERLGAVVTEIKSAKELIQHMDRKKNGNDKEEQLNSLKKEFFQEHQIPEFLQQVTILANQMELNIVSVSPQVIMVVDSHKKIPFEIVLEGGYKQLIEYLNDLEQIGRLVHVTEIQISSIENKYPDLRITLLVTAYVLR